MTTTTEETTATVSVSVTESPTSVLGAIVASLVAFLKKIDAALALVADRDPKSGAWYFRNRKGGSEPATTIPVDLRPFVLSAEQIESQVGRPKGMNFLWVVETVSTMGNSQMSTKRVMNALCDLRDAARAQLAEARALASRIGLDEQAEKLGVVFEPGLPVLACEKRIAAAKAEIASCVSWVRNVGARVNSAAAELKLGLVVPELADSATLDEARKARSDVDADETRVREIRRTRELEAKRLREESERKAGIRTVRGHLDAQGRFVTRDDERRDQEYSDSQLEAFRRRYPNYGKGAAK